MVYIHHKQRVWYSIASQLGWNEWWKTHYYIYIFILSSASSSHSPQFFSPNNFICYILLYPRYINVFDIHAMYVYKLLDITFFSFYVIFLFHPSAYPFFHFVACCWFGFYTMMKKRFFFLDDGAWSFIC